MFDIKFTKRAVEDLRSFSKTEQAQILAALEAELPEGAMLETGDRKRLDAGGPMEWEFRIGKVRVFYDVDVKKNRVKIKAIGKMLLI